MQKVISIVLIISLLCLTTAEFPSNRDYCADPWVQERFDCAACEELWSDTTQALLYGDYDQFMKEIAPYFKASNILYSYRDDAFSKVEGWDTVKVKYPMKAGGYGMHAIAWRNQADPRKVMVGMRGTWDVYPWGPEEHSDLCAGWYLMEYMSRPDFCDDFTEEDMNYYRQLEIFLLELRSELDGDFCLAFTGHSLGSFLSITMSIAWNASMPAYSFSGPGILWSLDHRLMIPYNDARSRNSLNIFNQFDPVVEVSHFLNNQTGWLLRFTHHSPPEECLRCVESEVFDYLAPQSNCRKCAFVHHELEVMETYMAEERRRPDGIFRFPIDPQAPFAEAYKPGFE